MKNEADVKKAVKKILTEAGWFLWMPPANAYGRSGIADIHAVKDGLLIVVETKFGNNKPTPLQKRFLKQVYDAGGIAAVVNEENIQQFENVVCGDAARVATIGSGLRQLKPRQDGMKHDILALAATRAVLGI